MILRISTVLFLIALLFPIHSMIWGYDSVNAQRILESNGYTEIVTGKHSMFSCPDEYYATKFEAKSPNGTKVTGAVCSGIFFKDSTIRFE